MALDINQLQRDLMNLESVDLDIGNDIENVLESLTLGTLGHGMVEIGATSGCASVGNTSGSCGKEPEIGA